MNRLSFLCLLLILFIPPAVASIDTELEAVKAQLELFEKNADSSNSSLKETYQQIYQQLLDSQRLAQEANEYRSQIEQLPQLLIQARADATRPPSPLPDIDTLAQPELEQLLVRYKAALLELQKQQSEVEQSIRSSDQKLLDMRAQLAGLQQKLNTAPATSVPPKNEQQKAKALLESSTQRSLQAKVESLELAILALPGNTELATLRRANLEKQVQQHKSWINLGEQRLQQQSRAAAEKALSEFEQNKAATDHPYLRQALIRNQTVSEQLRNLIAKRTATLSQRQALEQQLELMNQSYRAIQLQLEFNIGYIGSEIRKHIQQLSKPLNTEKTHQAINQLRLNQLALNQQQIDQSSQPGEIITPPLSTDQQQHLAQLEADHQSLRAEIRTAQQQQINELSQLLALQNQINDQIKDSRTLFNKHLLWLPSTQPISTDWPTELVQGTAAVLESAPLMFSAQFSALATRWGWPLFLFLFSLTPAWLLRNYLRERQPVWVSQIGDVSHDRIGNALRPLLYGPLTTLPLPLLFYSSGLIIDNADPYPDLRTVCYVVAFLTWLYLSLLFWMKQPNGLLQGQFALPPSLVKTLRKRIQLLYWVNTPLIATLLTLDALDSEVIRSGPSRIFLVLLTLGFTLFWLSLWRRGPLLLNSRSNKPRIWSNVRGWIVLLTLFNLCMLGLILWGYMLSASILIGLLFILVSIAMLVYMLFQLGQRWLLIEGRKLQFARTKARRAEILTAREDQKDEPPLKEEFVDLQTISAQGGTLLKTGCAVIFITLLWLTLGWTLPTLDVLDSFTLWSTASSTSDGEVLSAVSLKQVLFAFAALTITLIAARNLPGLLELLILNYLPLAPGTSFAVSTLLKYLLIIIGLISFLNLLGLEWGKLQWLIAALGVGLGFGLQEIVANFVSGLIILFEKPVRIGDTVTIGGVTGAVSRIQIRATTITDWDRKEVIIPNKTFITDQLINWSLTDAVTRIIIKVGVAYGSDTELTQRLLLQAAAENSHVLKEPVATALFMTFGNSTLDFELRAHVSSMELRTLTVHELNNQIDKLFRQHNIEIAFPQLDIHLRSDNRDKPA